MDILDGKTLVSTNTNEYKILNTLSVGGKGCVYLVEDIHQDRYALKVFYHHEYEKEALSQLILKNNKDLIKKNQYEFVLPVEIFKINVNDKVHTAFITKYIDDGKNIEGFIKTFTKDKDFNYLEYIKKSLTVMYNIACAFSYLHEKGYCYTNIDQSTIRINTNNLKVYIIKADDITLQTNDCTDKLGSVRYLAPERIEDKLSPSCRTDRYSLSVIFFELLLLGLHPYIGSKTYNDYVESTINFGPFTSTTREYKTVSNFILNYGNNAPFIFSENVKAEVFDEDFIKYYNLIPKEIRDIFEEEFTLNVRHPKLRTHITTWRNTLERIIKEFNTEE